MASTVWSAASHHCLLIKHISRHVNHRPHHWFCQQGKRNVTWVRSVLWIIDGDSVRLLGHICRGISWTCHSLFMNTQGSQMTHLKWCRNEEQEKSFKLIILAFFLFFYMNFRSHYYTDDSLVINHFSPHRAWLSWRSTSKAACLSATRPARWRTALEPRVTPAICSSTVTLAVRLTSWER